ncbi:MAG: MG2 domain-containing protein [Arenicella sp.]
MKKTFLLSACLLSISTLAILFAQGKFSPESAQTKQVNSLYDSASFNAVDSPDLEITRIIPNGIDVPASNRQIVFKFNQPVVPIGDMQRTGSEIPITIKPIVNCQWLWLDTSSLSCQLDEKNSLNMSTEYTISIKPGIVSTNGASMKKDHTHRFTTQRPAFVRSYLHEWSSLEKPLITLRFNQAVTRKSVLETVQFKVASNKITPVNIERDWNPLTDEHYFLKPSDKEFTFVPSTPIYNLSDEKRVALQTTLQKKALREKWAAEARTIWIISPKQGLPTNSNVTLSLKGGLRSAFGPEPGLPESELHQFKTLPEFSFLGVSCYSPESHIEVIIQPRYSSQDPLRETFDQQQQASKKIQTQDIIKQCNPLARISLRFSSPVSVNEIKQHLTLNPDLAGDRIDYDPWGNSHDQYWRSYFLQRQYADQENGPYSIRLPEYLKAFERYDLSNSAELKDEFGRSLTTPIDMSFLTAHRDKRLVLDHRHAVLEKNVDTDVPIVVTNLDKITVPDYYQLSPEGLKEKQQHTSPLANVEDVSYPVRLGVRKMLKDQPGVVVGYVDSIPTTYNYSQKYYRFMAQVTPYQVHFKLGHFNSFAWVTDMATGQVVADAKVQLYLDDYPSLSDKADSPSIATTDKDGVALLPGIVDIDPTLNFVQQYRYEEKRFFLRIDKGKDMALLPLDYYYQSDTNIWPNLRAKNHHMHAWGMTAQGVYKVGDTIQYKLYVRNQNNKHWVLPELSNYALKIIDPKGQTVEDIPSASLSKFGAYSGEFKVPQTAAVGWYRFELTAKNSDQGTRDKGARDISLSPMKVLVSDFTPAPFRVTTDLNGDQFQPGDIITVTSLAKMHAGGPYADAQTRVSATLSPRRFRSKHPQAKGFYFEQSLSHNSLNAHQSSATVDKQGELTTSITLDDYGYHFGRLTIESAVRDDRGKFVAGSTSADYIGRDRFIGLRDEQWVHEAGQPASIDLLVVNEKGQPESGVNITVVVEHQVTKAARTKGAGNAFLTQYTTEWEHSTSCQKTSAKKVTTCDYTPTKPGSYRLTATIKDSQGRQSQNQLHTWVIGEGSVMWNQANNNRLQIVPDSESYKIGDTAKFLVKNPYPGAQAIISVERYGVLRHWQQTLEGSTPIIELPIEADDYPGVYLSVVVASPRVAQPMGDGNVDLGKPSFKMGYVKVPVRDIQKEIDISVSTDKQTYRPRDTVKVKVSANTRSNNKDPMELAVVVLDEAVFDLNRSGRSYYDPYKGFNRLDNLGVSNYNLLMRLVGRQAFPKKGANPGGGGGEGSNHLRNLMKFVSYWNPSIDSDSKGQANFEFELPDNLTGWRVFVMAVTPNDHMGLGDTSFKVNQPIELRPVMPNQLTEGDQFQAGFSVMNRTAKARTITVNLQAAGDAMQEPSNEEFILQVKPYERKKIYLPITAKKSGELAFLASASSGEDSDALEHHIPVNKRRSLVTAATYGTTTQTNVAEKIAFPDNIYSDVGGISLIVSPSVLGNITGAFRYARDYPYYCWEQRLAKGVFAAQHQQLKAYLPDDFSWPDSENLAQQTLDNAHSFQAPNGGMTYWVNKDAHVSPYLSAYTALSFNWLRDQGYIVPTLVETKLHAYLQQLLRHDHFPQHYSQGLRSSIRAVALAALAANKTINKQELKRYRPHFAKMDLFGKAHYLQAATELGTAETDIVDMTNNILSYSVQSGGKFQFNDIIDNGYEAMLRTPLRSNCAILSSLLKVVKTTVGGLALVGDVPFKQVRAITQTRGNRDHWENTQENIFCMNAMVDFSQLYESDQPDMKITASLKPSKTQTESSKQPDIKHSVIGTTKFNDLRNEPVTLSNEDINIVPGLQGNVNIDKMGTGRLYYGLRMQYANQADNAKRINAGIEIRREYSVKRLEKWWSIDNPLTLKRGELVRIDIFVTVPTARHYVVIDDPVPGGLEPVNRDLATASSLDSDNTDFTVPKASWWHSQKDWVSYGRYGYSFYHKELRHDSARFYADYLPIGNYHLTYTAQAIADGQFSVMPVKAEEMYDPDVYGLGLPAELEVKTSTVQVQ